MWQPVIDLYVPSCLLRRFFLARILGKHYMQGRDNHKIFGRSWICNRRRRLWATFSSDWLRKAIKDSDLAKVLHHFTFGNIPREHLVSYFNDRYNNASIKCINIDVNMFKVTYIYVLAYAKCILSKYLFTWKIENFSENCQ